MKGHFRALMILTGLCCLPTILVAQFNPGQGSYNAGIGDVNQGYMNQRAWVVGGKVATLDGTPLAGVKVSVQPTVAAEFRVLTTDFQGRFQTTYQLNAELSKDFGVVLVVNQKGYQKAQAVVDYNSVQQNRAIPITLREAKSDAKLLSQDEMMAAVAPRLRKLGAADGLTSKSEKDYARGVEEFLDRGRSDRALPSLTKVVAHDPSCVGCRMMLGLAELDSGDWDGANRNFSQAVDDVRKATHTKAGEKINAADAKLGGGRPEPALALGVMESWRHQYDRAAAFEIEALQYAPQDPLALQEAGRAELLLQNWDTANAFLAKAESAGAGQDTALLRAQALLGGGNFDGANVEMMRYLNGRNIKTMPLTVREVWSQIAEKKKIEVVYVKEKPKANDPIDYLHRPITGLQDFVPAQDQTPLAAVLTEAGKRVELYFRDFPNTVSLEQIHQEKLSRKGKIGATLEQKFHYICLTPTENEQLEFTEYRADLSGEKGQPQGLRDGFMLTSGFASASILFHPLYQADSVFRYLGKQKIDGRDTFVLAFAQKPEKARMYGQFKMGDTSMPTFSQGLAWVDAENYAIIRMRTDLLKPLPEIRLEKETTDIEFGETHFKSIADGLWLPREVKVNVSWNGKNLLNKHTYSDFRFFNVGATQKIGNPKEAGGTTPQQPSSQTRN